MVYCNWEKKNIYWYTACWLALCWSHHNHIKCKLQFKGPQIMRNFKLTFPTKIGNKFLSLHGCKSTAVQCRAVPAHQPPHSPRLGDSEDWRECVIWVLVQHIFHTQHVKRQDTRLKGTGIALEWCNQKKVCQIKNGEPCVPNGFPPVVCESGLQRGYCGTTSPGNYICLS